MAGRRPFAGIDALLKAASEFWAGLSPSDWLEAFRHHPRIGDKESLRRKFASTGAWASQEQAGTAGADEEVLDELARSNALYEEKFGFIFIVCATGRSAGEMLADLKKRLGNDPEAELRVAAAEQDKIIRLRLLKLLENK